MEQIKAEFKEKFDITLNDEQAKVIQAKRRVLNKAVETVETVQYWQGRPQTVTKINGFRI